MHTQDLCRLHTIAHDHEVSELALPVLTNLETSSKAMMYILLDPMMCEVVHEFKPLIHGTNDYYCPNGNNLYQGYTAGFNDDYVMVLVKNDA